MQFENIFNYFKKGNSRIKLLKIVFDQLIAIKTKSDTVFPSIEVSIDTSRNFLYILFLAINKSQPTLRV